MDILKELLQDGEVIATFGLSSSYSNYNCIIGEESDDISGALEDTGCIYSDGGRNARIRRV